MASKTAAAPKLEIKRWQAICTWKLGGVGSEVCAVCRNKLDEASVAYKVGGYVACGGGLLGV